MQNSEKHREKLKRLREDPSIRTQEINNVRVCFSEEFIIGRGSNGTNVYPGLGKDGSERAVKRIQRNNSCSAEQEKKMLNEHNTIKSNHVVKYRYLDDHSDHDWVYLIMDLYEETLKDFVEKSSLDDCSTVAQDIIQQVLKGLADLHCRPQSILHRDLKPSNILRNAQNEWLIADFGISRILPQDESVYRSEERGTKHWKAVESCCSKYMSNAEVPYKRESDIQVQYKVLLDEKY